MQAAYSNMFSKINVYDDKAAVVVPQMSGDSIVINEANPKVCHVIFTDPSS